MSEDITMRPKECSGIIDPDEGYCRKCMVDFIKLREDEQDVQ